MTAPAAPPTSAPPIGAPTVEPTTAPVPAPIAPPVSALSVGLFPHAAVRSPRPTSAATGAKFLNDIVRLLFAKLVQPTQRPHQQKDGDRNPQKPQDRGPSHVLTPYQVPELTWKTLFGSRTVTRSPSRDRAGAEGNLMSFPPPVKAPSEARRRGKATRP